MGFHAAAGLNGQGLHAEAGTPFGQKASAGLGGSLGNDGAAAGKYKITLLSKVLLLDVENKVDCT